jgi:hypothetical protein
MVRARAVGLARNQPDSRAVPALVGHLGDDDPVVRLAAHEELRRRTGRDFGYVPWSSPEERSSAIGRWRAWLRQGSGGAGSGAAAMPTGQVAAPEALPLKSLPAGAQPTSSP